MGYDIRLEDAPPGRWLAVVRRHVTRAELSRVVPQCCGIVWDAIRAQGIKGAGRHVAIYLDGEINVEVGVELTAEVAAHGEVICSQLPAGLVVTTTHFGPYNRLCDAHQAIRDWCGKRGHSVAGPNWEIYGHWVDAWNSDASRIRTDVFYLLSTDTGVTG